MVECKLVEIKMINTYACIGYTYIKAHPYQTIIVASAIITLIIIMWEIKNSGIKPYEEEETNPGLLGSFWQTLKNIMKGML